MAFGINVKEITAQFNAKFDLLIAKLQEILEAIQKKEA